MKQKRMTFENGTAIEDEKVAMAANLQAVGATKRGVVTIKRGKMALAAECDESNDNDEDKEDNDVDVQRNSKKRNKREE